MWKIILGFIVGIIVFVFPKRDYLLMKNGKHLMDFIKIIFKGIIELKINGKIIRTNVDRFTADLNQLLESLEKVTNRSKYAYEYGQKYKNFFDTWAPQITIEEIMEEMLDE